MNFYTISQIDELKEEHIEAGRRFINLYWKFSDLWAREIIKDKKALEFLLHGASRRVKVIKRCIDNIYEIFPPDRESLLKNDELTDVVINMHAFLINSYGLLENLAWAWIYEKEIKSLINNKWQVGLFKAETQEHFTEKFRAYLNTENIQNWNSDYLVNYRDALAHQIPLYVPPKHLTPEQIEKEKELEIKIRLFIKSNDFDAVELLRNEQENLGSVAPMFIHSLTTENKYAILHYQIINDFKTIEEIVNNYCEMYLPKS